MKSQLIDRLIMITLRQFLFSSFHYRIPFMSSLAPGARIVQTLVLHFATQFTTLTVSIKFSWNRRVQA